jgi:hypothetical protein
VWEESLKAEYCVPAYVLFGLFDILSQRSNAYARNSDKDHQAYRHGICISSVDQNLAASLGKRDAWCGVDLLAPFVSTRLAACDDWRLILLTPCTPVLTIDSREATAIEALKALSA